jgi:hypothetical protein
MFLLSALSGLLRAVAVAAATGAAVFGLLVVFHPFAPPALPAAVTVDATTSDVLRTRIDAARTALRQTEAALGAPPGQSLAVGPSPSVARDQLESQLADAVERRDLALRHAKAIRDVLTAGLDVSSLAGIRDSVVVGQLLAQQAALDQKLAEQGARLKANHPVMRALQAQRNALTIQITSEAASIATALESEAKLDDAEVKMLQSQLGASPARAAVATPSVKPSLETQLSTQRAELDGLMDAYFGLKPATAALAAPNLLSPLNLLTIAVAALAALIFQAALSLRRARQRREAADIARWRDDRDVASSTELVPVTEDDPILRQAS